ncbi:MAG: sugar ABC transporter ATP-binding protein [Planctomycetes bacterium]|nr:sugar ABC transporter ATP-binding protein [Planctomycetota bacterium]
MSVAADASNPLIAVRGIVKDFAATRALDGVNLDIRAGEVLGLVGENGAGKSTLMKVLGGIETPTAGSVSIDGHIMNLRGPADAQRLGIAMIHQELNLVDELTVADNIFLGRERVHVGAGRWFVDRAVTRAGAWKWLAEISADIDPDTPVKRLSIAQKQMVEIARALSCDARVLIMDEPTAVLTARETTALLAEVRRLRGRGVAIVYISHLLGEVLGVCDRVVVLRDGRLVTVVTPGELGTGHVAEARLASLMVGREMADHFPPREPSRPGVVLEVKGLSVAGRVEEAGFTLHDGEILGFAGLIGAGRTELAEGIVGLRRVAFSDGGGITLSGKPLKIGDVRDSVEAGIAYLSEDRKGHGLVLGMGVAENTTLAALRGFCRPLIDRGAEEVVTAEYVRALSIRVGGLRDRIDTLSGGNQQKIALAKWLQTGPKVLILDEPTRGVDIGAKEEIYRHIQMLTRRGVSCIVISSELNELLGLCHRVIVMRRGRIAATLDGAAATEEGVMYHAAGVGATDAMGDA